MKGIVFSFKNNIKKRDNFPKNSGYSIRHRGDFNLKYFFKRYGVVAFFTLMLVVGITVGSMTSKNMSKDTLNSLDLFFTTNISMRLQNGGLGAFCSSFCSDFLFYLSTFLFGLSLWGIVFLPFISFFKGFGIGVSAGYLFTTYGFTGVMFYLAILLPGIFLFSMVLVYMSSSSYNISKRMLKTLFSKEDISIISSFKIYFQKCLLYLLITFFSALLDMLLWYVFAGLFNFN